MTDILSKGNFAALVHVSPSRVSQWLRQQKIFGNALVGDGRFARIRVSVAIDQLKQNLDITQRLGANARARFDDRGSTSEDNSDAVSPGTIENDIKVQRLQQLELANSMAREIKAARAGRYVLSEDATRQMGSIASRMIAWFEGSLGELATAIAAKHALPQRDVLHLLRSEFRAMRERASAALQVEAAALPKMTEDEPPAVVMDDPIVK